MRNDRYRNGAPDCPTRTCLEVLVSGTLIAVVVASIEAGRKVGGLVEVDKSLMVYGVPGISCRTASALDECDARKVRRVAAANDLATARGARAGTAVSHVAGHLDEESLYLASGL